MDDLKNFKLYFNRDFWRAFQNKQPIFDIPKTKKGKDLFIEDLYNEIEKKKYYPSIPRCYIDRDKGNCVTRIIPVFELKDYCVYYYCIKKIENKIAINRVKNTFGGWTLGGLIRKNEDDEMDRRRQNFNRYEDFIAELNGVSVTQYTFNPAGWAKAYGDLNSKLYAIAKTSNYSYVAELDIANYYDSIRLDILEMRVREIVNEEHADIVSLLFHFLNYWNRNTNHYNKQTVGLPQDAMGDCSRILANFYLQPYDKIVYDMCNQNSCCYLRYADDQFIFSKNKDKLNYLIFKISKVLNTLGLSVNQKKVKIYTTQELINYRSFKIFNILKKDVHKKDKNKVEQFVDCYISLLNNAGFNNVKDQGKPLLNKALFCPALKNIDLAKKTKLLGCYLDDNYLKDCRATNLEKIYHLFKKSDRPLFIKKLNKLSKKLIHNAFHYELLNFLERNKINAKIVKSRINRLSKL